MNNKKANVWHRLAKFFARATYNDQCIEYYPDKYNDYIHLKNAPPKYFKTNSTSLHRFVYAVWNDHALTTDDVIMHTCDNRRCCNPDHLVGGTRHDNMLDAMRKGRLRGRNYLEEFGMTRSEFADKLNISPANLSNRLKKWGNPYYNPKN